MNSSAGYEDLCGYDAVIGITMDTINSQLIFLQQDKSIEEESADGTQSVKAKLFPPTVELKITEGMPHELILYVNFGEGLLVFNKAQTPTKIQLINRSLGFVSMIESKTQTKAELKRQYETGKLKDALQNLNDERFEVEHLYIAWRKTITRDNLITTIGFNDLDAAKVLVDLVIQHFSKQSDELKSFTLGLIKKLRDGVKQNNSDCDFPDLTPTFVDYSMTFNTTHPRWSTFNFLLMSGNRQAPMPKPRIDWQFIDSNDMQGRYIIAERLWLQGGVLKAIQRKLKTEQPFTKDNIGNLSLSNEFNEDEFIDQVQIIEELQYFGSDKVMQVLGKQNRIIKLDCAISIEKQNPLSIDIIFAFAMQINCQATTNQNITTNFVYYYKTVLRTKWVFVIKDELQLNLSGNGDASGIKLAEMKLDFGVWGDWAITDWFSVFKFLNQTKSIRDKINALSGEEKDQKAIVFSYLHLMLMNRFRNTNDTTPNSESIWAPYLWPQKNLDDLINRQIDQNMNQVILPLAENFYFKNPMANGINNYNLQIDLAIKD